MGTPAPDRTTPSFGNFIRDMGAAGASSQRRSIERLQHACNAWTESVPRHGGPDYVAGFGLPWVAGVTKDWHYPGRECPARVHRLLATITPADFPALPDEVLPPRLQNSGRIP